MPIYEYECQKCDERFELLHLNRKDQESVHCPRCRAAEVQRVLSTFSSGQGESAGANCGPSGST